MGMDDAADEWPVPEKHRMRKGVRGWTKVPFHYFAVEINDHDHVRFQGAVRHPAGFDRENAPLMICHADITEGEQDQPEFRQFQVRMTGFFLE